MAHSRSDSGSTIFNDTRAIFRDEEGCKSEHQNQYSVSSGAKTLRRMWPEAPSSPNDRSPKRLKIADTSFDGELPNQMIKAVLACAEQAIKKDKEDILCHFMESVEKCYQDACLQFEGKREGRVRELKSVISTDQMSEWLQESDWKDQDITTRLRNIALPLWSIDLATSRFASPSSPSH